MTNRRTQRFATPTPPDHAAVGSAISDDRRRLQSAGRRELATRTRQQAGGNASSYGVSPADVHRIGLELVRRLRAIGLPTTIAIADQLFHTGNVEEGLVGAQIVGALARLITGKDFESIEPWGDQLTSAQTADALATHCLAPVLAAKPSTVKTMREWARSSNANKRRAAVAAFGPLVREGRFMTDSLEVAELVMEDADERVQQGVGTMLLEATRLKADRVVEFLMQWRATSPRLILQIAATKLSPALRQQVLGR